MTGPKHVLIVEDDAAVARSWLRALGAAGHEVELATTLAEARQLLEGAAARGEPFDAVVLDLSLPDGDGSELVAELEQREPRPGVGVVSGHLDGDRAVALWGKAIINVPKPLSSPAMVALAERLMDRADAHDAVLSFSRAHQLSERECLLLRRTAEGRSRQEIVAELDCSTSTITTFWRRIFDKTGLRAQRLVLSAVWEHAAHPGPPESS